MRLGGRWPLVSEQDATHVVVDMDSMYGPMSWLRLHGAGKFVIGLTSSPRAQTDFHLAKPFNAESVAELLQQIAPAGDAAAPHGITPAPAPQDQLPEELAKPVSEEAVAPNHRASAAIAATLDTPVAPPAPAVEARSAVPPAPSATAPVAPVVETPTRTGCGAARPHPDRLAGPGTAARPCASAARRHPRVARSRRTAVLRPSDAQAAHRPCRIDTRSRRFRQRRRRHLEPRNLRPRSGAATDPPALVLRTADRQGPADCPASTPTPATAC